MGKMTTLGVFAILAVLLTSGCGSSAPETKPAPAPAAPSTNQITPVPAVASTNETVPASNKTVPALPASTIPEGVSVNNAAIDFQLQTLAGKTISLKDLRGKPVLLNFWATWCPPCIGEMPSIQLVNYERQGKDVTILTVDIIGSRPTETPATLADFMQKNQYTFPVVLDVNQKVTKSYLVVSIPTTFLIDKDGIIRYKRLGPFEDKAAIDAALKLVTP